MVFGAVARPAWRARALRSAAAMVAVVSLSGCWFQEGGGPGNTRSNLTESSLTADTVGTLAVDWRSDDDAALSEPVISGDRVYVTARSYATGEGAALSRLSVQAFDRGSGDLLWETSLLPEDAEVEGDAMPVGLIDGALWVPYWHSGMPACTGRIERLDAESGLVLGSDPTPTRPTSSVVVGRGLVALTGYNCAGESSEVAVLEPATRARRWSHTFQVGHSATTPTMVGDMLVIKTSAPRVAAQTLYGFRAQGCGAPACGFSWDLRDAPFAQGRPVAGPDGSVFDVVYRDDGLHVRSVDTATGQVEWTSSLAYSGSLPGGLSGMATADGVLYVTAAPVSDGAADVDGKLDAYAAGGCGAAACAPEWTTAFGPGATASTAPAVAGGVVYSGVGAGPENQPAIVAVDAAGCGQATCDELTRVELVTSDGPPLLGLVPTQLSVGGGRVFAVWLPGLSGDALSQVVSLAPASSA
jgi:outer membrane protein assembly factor BamB